MEKNKAHYNLAEIKKVFIDPDNLGQMTGSARNGARELRLSDDDIVNVIQSLSIKDFYKSMTSHYNHSVWHDVYFPFYQGRELYVKFSRDEENRYYILISFKKS